MDNYKNIIKERLRLALINESEKKEVPITYLEWLLNNVHNNLAKKFLNGWIKRGGNGSVKLSPREYIILTHIKAGGILPKQFHPKN